MTPFADLIQQGASHAWLFIPAAILLGALHGLEPGHSKTMMAAFIIAVRGTVAQAVSLGLAATVSHTLVVWAVALVGLHYAGQFNTATTEPYLQVASAVLIIGVAGWIAWRTWDDRQQRRPAGHEHGHDYDVPFVEGAGGHDHLHEELHRLDVTTGGDRDAHELAHADGIRRRFADRNVTTGQIVMFGLTSGLIPCPAAITVLLLCLQLRQITLGVGLVLCFSIGLAMTMVTVGIVAALSIRHVSERWSGFGDVVTRVPYLSSAIIGCIGLYVGWQGLHALHTGGVI